MEMQSIGTPALWAGFVGFVLLMLALDLGVFHRKSHEVTFKEATVWSTVWVSLSLVFSGLVYWKFGSQAGTEFLTGYFIEKSLSVDNVFVFVVIFGAMRIPAVHQHRVLFWGILGALAMRAIMIFAGVALLARFHWLIYLFGAFLVLTGIKLYREWRKGHEAAPEDSWAMRMITRLIPSTDQLDGAKFFTLKNGRRLATPLFISLVLVEFTDVVFALDSIPAIFAITQDPFIIFTSNIFAILGLRSLYFMLAGMVDRFSYLKVGLSGVLVFVGLKMALVDVIKVPAMISLAIIAAMLSISVIASLLKYRREHPLAELPGGSQDSVPRENP